MESTPTTCGLNLAVSGSDTREETNMAELPPEVEDDSDSAGADKRWRNVFGIVAIGLVVLFVVLHLTGLAGAGMHGMGG